jgi:hypothetical protein
MAGQGRCMPVESIRQVIRLLSSTEMTIIEIAERMSCSRSAVLSINRKFQVRAYNGRRSWVKPEQKVGVVSKEEKDKTEGVGVT